MPRRFQLLFIFPIFLSAFVAAAPKNILNANGISPLSQYMGQAELGQLAGLRDGDIATAVVIQTPVEFLLKFDELSSLSNLVIHSAPAPGNTGIAEVEVLASIASASSGFKRLRQATVDGQSKRKSYRFRPEGARWLMIRITPAGNKSTPPITEIELHGHVGPPASSYEFKESPASAIAVVERIQASLDTQISADEQSLFADAADGSLDSWSLADAALMASGVTDAAQRAKYNEHLDAIAQQSVQAVNSVAPMQKAQALLRWIHTVPMKAGYIAEQTDLSILLDKNTYNCVSSAVLFSILGQRHGLDVRGIEVPDHAFAIVYDGTNVADVETTTAEGFNPSRERKAADAFAARTGFAYIPDSKSSLRRETSAVGLVALIYYNHGVALNKSGQHQAALLSYFRALSLDKEMDSAVKNALATIGNWSISLLKEQQYARALDVLELGLALAPDDYGLRHNRRAVWQQRINASLEQADRDASLALISSAHAADPKAGFMRQKAYLFIRPAKALADKLQWQAALQETARGKPQLAEQALKELIRYETNLVLQWSSAEIANKQWQKALDALAQGLQLKPGEYRFRQNIAYVLQEWSAAEEAANGEDSAAAIVDKILQQFPQLRETKRVGRSFAIRRVQDLLQKNQYAEALDAVRKYKHMLPREREVDTLVRSVYDKQASAFSRTARWEQAVAVYAEARIAFPDNAQLRKNEAASWHSWARTYMESEDWLGALAVFEKALVQSPKERSYAQNIVYSVQELLASRAMEEPANQTLARDLLARFPTVNKLQSTIANQYMKQVDGLVNRQQFRKALELATSSSVVLNKRTAVKPVRYATDAWARYHTERQEWQQAVDAYREGLQIIPNDGHLKRNSAATWHAWAKPYLNKQGCKEAISIYKTGLEHIPNNSAFKQNIRYCQQQLGR